MVERVSQTALAAADADNDVPDEPPNRHGGGKSSSFFDVGEENQQLKPEQEMELSTYVVQIPKDQIYRVPPPENAKLVERLRNPSVKKGTPSCGRVLWIVLILLAVGAVIGGTLLVLRQVYSPEAAVFSVVNFAVTNNKKERPRYEITMHAKNPNDKVEMSYPSKGAALLYFKTHKLASGNFPGLHQGGSDSRNVNVVLAGGSPALPDEVSKSMKDGKRDRPVSLELQFNLKGEMSLGVLNLWSSKEMNVVCGFIVSTLKAGTKTKILSQKCENKIK